MTRARRLTAGAWREETSDHTGNKSYYNNSATLETKRESRPVGGIPAGRADLSSISQSPIDTTLSDRQDEDKKTTPAAVGWDTLVPTLWHAKRAWCALVDSNTGSTYYFDEATGASQWEKPPEMDFDEPQNGERVHIDLQEVQDINSNLRDHPPREQVVASNENEVVNPVDTTTVEYTTDDENVLDAGVRSGQAPPAAAELLDADNTSRLSLESLHSVGERGISVSEVEGERAKFNSLRRTSSQGNRLKPDGQQLAASTDSPATAFSAWRTPHSESDDDFAHVFAPGVEPVTTLGRLETQGSGRGSLGLKGGIREGHNEVLASVNTEEDERAGEGGRQGEEKEDKEEEKNGKGENDRKKEKEEMDSQEVQEDGNQKEITNQHRKTNSNGSKVVTGNNSTGSIYGAPAEEVDVDIHTTQNSGIAGDRTDQQSSPQARRFQGDEVENIAESNDRLHRVDSSSTLSTYGGGLDSLAQYVTGHSSTLDRGAVVDVPVLNQEGGGSATETEGTDVQSAEGGSSNDTTASETQRSNSDSISRSESKDNKKEMCGHSEVSQYHVVKTGVSSSSGGVLEVDDSCIVEVRSSFLRETLPTLEQRKEEAGRSFSRSIPTSAQQQSILQSNDKKVEMLEDQLGNGINRTAGLSWPYVNDEGGKGIVDPPVPLQEKLSESERSPFSSKEETNSISTARLSDGHQYTPRSGDKDGTEETGKTPAGASVLSRGADLCIASLYPGLSKGKWEGRGVGEQVPVMQERSSRQGLTGSSVAKHNHSPQRPGTVESTVGLREVPPKLPTDETSALPLTASAQPTSAPGDNEQLTQTTQFDQPVDDTIAVESPPAFDTAAVAALALKRLQAGMMIRRQQVASVKLQAQARRWAARRLCASLLERRETRRREEREAKNRAATAIQAVARTRAARKERQRRAREMGNQHIGEESAKGGTDNQSDTGRDKPKQGSTKDLPVVSIDDPSLFLSEKPQRPLPKALVMPEHHGDNLAARSRLSEGVSNHANSGNERENSNTTDKHSEGSGDNAHGQDARNEVDYSKGWPRTLPGEREPPDEQWREQDNEIMENHGWLGLVSAPLRLETIDEEERQLSNCVSEEVHASARSNGAGQAEETGSLGKSRLDEAGSVDGLRGLEYSSEDNVVDEETTDVTDDGGWEGGKDYQGRKSLGSTASEADKEYLSELTVSDSDRRSDDDYDRSCQTSVSDDPQTFPADKTIENKILRVAGTDRLEGSGNKTVVPPDTVMNDEIQDVGKGFHLEVVSKMRAEAGVYDDATAPVERLEDLRSLVAGQAEATARLTMTVFGTGACRLEANRIRYVRMPIDHSAKYNCAKRRR